MKLLILVSLALVAGIVSSLPVGINIDPRWPGGYPTPDEVVATGAQWVRFEFRTGTAFNSNSDSSSSSGSAAKELPTYEAAVAAYNAAGISTVVTLDYNTVLNSPITQGGNASQWAAYVEEYVSQVALIAQGLRNMKGALEIWKEPDVSITHVPAATYGVMLQKSYEAIRAVNKSIVVLVGGLGSGDPTYIEKAAAATNNILYADQIGIHAYGVRPTPDWPSPRWGTTTIGELLEKYQKAAPAFPMIITEVGTDDLYVQGVFPYKFFEAVNTLPLVTACLWYCWSDAMVSPLGLVNSTGSPKADYYSFINFTNATGSF